MNNKITALAALALVSLLADQAAAADGGDQIFKRYCNVCHSTEVGQNKVGPSLAGIVGRKSGEEAGFSYSDAMQGANLQWDEKTLDTYLADPKGVVPGTKMLFLGVKNPDERHNLIEYLKTLKS